MIDIKFYCSEIYLKAQQEYPTAEIIYLSTKGRVLLAHFIQL